MGWIDTETLRPNRKMKEVHVHLENCGVLSWNSLETRQFIGFVISERENTCAYCGAVT